MYNSEAYGFGGHKAYLFEEFYRQNYEAEAQIFLEEMGLDEADICLDTNPEFLDRMWFKYETRGRWS